MSSDKAFFTNEPGRTVLERFQTLLGKNTKFFDCLVGYFYLSGFHRLYHSFEETEQIRILVGLKTDKKTFDLIQEAEVQRRLNFSHSETKDQIGLDVLEELETSDDSAEIECGIRKFIEWCNSGKLQIKAYPSAKIHAKVYIMTFVEGQIERGHVITGSSNFSYSGLEGNLEFNVELKSPFDYEFALEKFNELWKEAVDVSPVYVETINEKSPFAEFAPFELYLKFLYEYFKTELSQPDDFESANLPDRFKKLKYQSDAVFGAKKILDEYGGVFLSDVVGLGKTFMSALLAQELDGRTLVIAPPALLDENNPGSWRNVFKDFRIPADFESIGKLDRAIERTNNREYKNIFVDESHRFRTETNETYEKLTKICRGKRVVLVSATPLNNSPKDILSQIKLFQNGKNSTIPGVRNLETFFSRLENRLKGLDRLHDREEYFRTVQANAKEIREKVLKHLMIRRTRSEISKYYGEDLAAQEMKFPEVANPQPTFYTLDRREDEIFTRTIERLTRQFKYARYRPLTYYNGSLSENELTGQRNLAVFMKILLVKRLESSFYAFRLSLDRFIHSYQRFIDEFRKGAVYTTKKYANRLFEMLEDGNLAGVEELIETDAVQKFSAEDFNADFLPDLENDLRLLKEVRKEWQSITRDPKWEKLKTLLETEDAFSKNKLIFFTESKETAQYLTDLMNKEAGEQALLFSGGSSQGEREKVLQNFDANAFVPKNDYRILVTTDTLAEGVNLHRSNTVINYDIPWNPTRMIQRVGRVNRVDTRFEQICTYNFFPTEQSNSLIKLKEAAEAKIEAFIEMLGADARLLTEGEEIKSHDLFEKLLLKETITGEDEEEESELEYLKVIRDVRDNQPDLFDRIKRLPRKARAGKLQPKQAGNALLTFFRKGKLEKFFYAGASSDAKEIDFLTAVKFLECEPETEKQIIGSNSFYALLDKNKTAFIYATTEEAQLEALTGAARDTATKIYGRLRTNNVRHFRGFTEEDEEFISRVVKLAEDGAMPRATAKRTWEGIKNEINPLKILAILRKEIAPQLFEETLAQKTRGRQSPREVILSGYLVGE